MFQANVFQILRTIICEMNKISRVRKKKSVEYWLLDEHEFPMSWSSLFKRCLKLARTFVSSRLSSTVITFNLLVTLVEFIKAMWTTIKQTCKYHDQITQLDLCKNGLCIKKITIYYVIFISKCDKNKKKSKQSRRILKLDRIRKLPFVDLDETIQKNDEMCNNIAVRVQKRIFDFRG